MLRPVAVSTFASVDFCHGVYITYAGAAQCALCVHGQQCEQAMLPWLVMRTHTGTASSNLLIGCFCTVYRQRNCFALASRKLLGVFFVVWLPHSSMHDCAVLT
eukprot:GHRR01015038.1.p5 GENE.GHRR01015038.1~~GHRR01015038.1.p5  ORF type:complete len:103 (+),score=16.31 GHRR01015038.1:1063-1371(+)